MPTKIRWIPNDNRIIPLKQNASYYYRKASRCAERGEFFDAIWCLRKAVKMEPLNADYLLDLAEICTEMNYYEESNQHLFRLQRIQKPVYSECYFGMGCNYMGLQEYDKAKESYEHYIHADPDGLYSEDIQELLDVIQSEEFSGLSISTSFSQEMFRNFTEGRQLLDRREYDKAAEKFEQCLATDPTPTFLRNNLSLAYYYSQREQQAEALAKGVLADEPDNVHALCNMALFLRKKGTKYYRSYLERIERLTIDDPDDLYKVAATLCDFSLHQQARAKLKESFQYRPYDKKHLHFYALCCWNCGLTHEALRCWEKILKAAPHSYVARYYRRMALDVHTGKAKAEELAYHQQIPYEAFIQAVDSINDLFHQPIDAVRKRWHQDEEFHALLFWGTELADETIKRAVLNILAAIGDQQAQEVLRDFLLRHDEPDAIKSDVFALLKQMKAAEPYTAYIDGQIVEACVNVFYTPDNAYQSSYAGVIEQLLSHAGGRYDQEAVSRMISLWNDYMHAVESKIRIVNQAAWAAALELLDAKRQNRTMNINELASEYEIWPSTIRRCCDKMKMTLQS